MVRIENAAKEYLSGKYSVVLKKDEDRKEDLEFELLVLEEDKIELMELQRKIDEDKSSKGVFAEQQKIIKNIINRSYPNIDDEQRAAIVMRYGAELLVELYFIWKWRNREVYEEMVKQAKKKLLETKEE